jgi:hypothetical protein
MRQLITSDRLQDLKALVAKGHKINLCNGLGVDSTAVSVLLHSEGIRPDVITFADTGGEKPETLAHRHILNEWYASIGWPQITVCAKVTLPSTSYEDLTGNCHDNETLPSLAFGKKSCSIKWKQIPQDYFLKGCKAPHNPIPVHPLWAEYQETGLKIIKIIGYDAGRADIRRSKKLKGEDNDFIFNYPLQSVGWARAECVAAITEAGLPVPVKSACYYCPASQKWELFWLAGTHPHLFLNALQLERGALTGHHSRFADDVDWITWEDLVSDYDEYPSLNTCVGLGRSFAWNQWARIEGIVDRDGKFIGNRTELLRKATEPREAKEATGGNAQDARTC